MQREVKMLLLGELSIPFCIADDAGAGESGKSTVLKQMRLIYNKYVQTSPRLTCMLSARTSLDASNLMASTRPAAQVGLHGSEAASG